MILFKVVKKSKLNHDKMDRENARARSEPTCVARSSEPDDFEAQIWKEKAESFRHAASTRCKGCEGTVTFSALCTRFDRCKGLSRLGRCSVHFSAQNFENVVSWGTGGIVTGLGLRLSSKFRLEMSSSSVRLSQAKNVTSGCVEDDHCKRKRHTVTH